jgi:hypothetical protein
MRNVSDKICQEYQNTAFFRMSCLTGHSWLYNITWWITKTTNTHSGYIILNVFLLQQWLHERASLLRLYVHCLPCFIAVMTRQVWGATLPSIEFVLGIKLQRTETGRPVTSDLVQDCVELSPLLHTPLCYGAFLNTGATFEVQVTIVVTLSAWKIWRQWH